MSLSLSLYQQAVHYFITDNKKSNASQLNQKCATLMTMHAEKYTEGAAIFEGVGLESLESRLGQFSAKNYFFSCLLCHLAAGDNVQVRNKAEYFKNKDHSFATSRECVFIEKIVSALESFDADAFAQECQDFDHITPLDPWKVKLLGKAKSQIAGAESADGEVDLT